MDPDTLVDIMTEFVDRPDEIDLLGGNSHEDVGILAPAEINRLQINDVIRCNWSIYEVRGIELIKG
jgi:hypothetical protein